MKSLITCLALSSLFITTSLFARQAPIYDALCLNYFCPAGANVENEHADHGILILSNNRITKFADWVAYIVDPKNLGGKSVDRHWHQDPDLNPDNTLSPRDYKGAAAKLKTDRGHQAPLGNFSTTHPLIQSTANYLSNITPQKANLNQGPWNNLEQQERVAAKNIGQLHVVTGTIYRNQDQAKLPKSRQHHVIPTDYFKVIASNRKGIFKISTFIMPQSASHNDSHCTYKSSISEIEKLTNMTILPNSPPAQGNLDKELGC